MIFKNSKIFLIIYFIAENVKRGIEIEEKEKKKVWSYKQQNKIINNRRICICKQFNRTNCNQNQFIRWDRVE